MSKPRKERPAPRPDPPLVESSSAPNLARSRDPRGRKKVKGQISVRIEQSYLDLAYAHAKITGERITDILERSIVKLVADETNEDRVARFARFLVLYATPEEQHVVISLLGYMRMPKRVFTTVFNEIYRDSFLRVLEEASKNPAFEEALRSYAPVTDEQWKAFESKFKSSWIKHEEVTEKIGHEFAGLKQELLALIANISGHKAG